ncbi:MAG: hypothetical protein JWR63_2739 [Conexibacter sp.]|nr:hypothetical protein [Conexibacter sp.]
MSTNPSATPLDQHASPVRARGQVSGLAIGAFICGLLGALTAVFIIPGAILGIIGLVLGLTSRGNSKRAGQRPAWQATAGAVLGGLALLAIVGIIIAAAAS